MHELDWLLYEKLPQPLQGQIAPESRRTLFNQIDGLISEGLVGVEGLYYWLKAKQADFLKEAIAQKDPIFRDYAYACAARYNSAERDPKVRKDLLDWRVNRAEFFNGAVGNSVAGVRHWQRLRDMNIVITPSPLDSQAQKR